ncbi:MAG: MFS transporter [Pseudomonadales bacterium]|nr:MFS transporter [Pseudomonadales bacterium]
MTKNKKLPFVIKLNYGIGQMAEGLKNITFSLFVLFYYNQVLEVSGTLCGLALVIALIFDAVSDPVAGSLSDNWQSKFGRRHPFMFASAIPLAISFYLLFSPPELSEMGLFLWLAVFALLTRAAMTLYHVPHIALGAELTENFEERTVVVGFRYVFSFIGYFVALAFAFLVYFAPSDAFLNGQLNRDAYSPFALTLAVLMLVTIWISVWGTRSQIPILPKAIEPAEAFSFKRVYDETLLALSNDSFRWLFIGIIIMFLMVGIDNTLNLYMNTYFWGLESKQIFAFAIASPIGIIVGVFFTQSLHKRWGKKAGIIFGVSWWAVFQTLPVLLRLLEYFPDNDDPVLLPLLVSLKFIQGCGVAQSLVGFSSMVADITDQHELQHGKRQEGIYFGAVSFSHKSASGLGTFAAGIFLDVINWPSGSSIESTADVPAETIFQLGLVYGPIVSAFAIISIWCTSHYQLTKAQHQDILDQLAVIRATAANSASSGSEEEQLAVPPGTPKPIE